MFYFVFQKAETFLKNRRLVWAVTVITLYKLNCWHCEDDRPGNCVANAHISIVQLNRNLQLLNKKYKIC